MACEDDHTSLTTARLVWRPTCDLQLVFRERRVCRGPLPGKHFVNWTQRQSTRVRRDDCLVPTGRKVTTMDKQLRDFARKVVEASASGIKDSAMYIGVTTPHFLKDPQCMIELGMAIMYDKPIVLVVMEGTVLPENLKKVAVAIEYAREGDEASMQRAVAAVAAKVDEYTKLKEAT